MRHPKLQIGPRHRLQIQGPSKRDPPALDKLNQLSTQEFVPTDAMAHIYVGLGEKGKAFEWLEKGYERHSIGLGSVGLKVDPLWDPLRSDPRFAELLRRMNL